MKNKNQIKRKITDQKPVIDKRDNIYLMPDKRHNVVEMAQKFKQVIDEEDYVWVDFKDSLTPYRKLMLRETAIKQNLTYYERN